MKPILASEDRDYPDGWPPKPFHTWPGDVTREQFDALTALVEQSASETRLDRFLRRNPAVLSTALWFLRTGHHGAWVIPQQEIRPPQQAVQHGLKPDLILGGHNSDGFIWAVVELKGADASVFKVTKNRVVLTAETTRAVFQILEYLDYASQAQAYLRDTLGLTNFREPKGILLIGRESEFADPTRERMKAAWNREFGSRIQLRTYDSLVRDVREWRQNLHRDA